ncbi:MAG: hypothetical protein HC810_01395 [Acaryochloridaceae cyanobacterium RL_2_7]|nr:hypothetical protein [Acaryochloridaceae cyanobacterium RL_2_7]
MKNILLTVLATASLSSLFSLPMAPAHACTPHPDHPDGCDDWPIRKIDPEKFQLKKPFPWPDNCLSCPTSVLKREALVIYPSILQDRVIQDKVQPLRNEVLFRRELQR